MDRFKQSKMIEAGNIVVIYNSEVMRGFHNLQTVKLEERRVVYIDCNPRPELKGEWEQEIRAAIPKVTELKASDDLTNRIIQQINVPNKLYFTLGS